MPIDEIKVMSKEQLKKLKKKNNEQLSEPIDWIKVGWIVLLIVTALVILLFMLPWIIWQYLNAKAKQMNASKAYNSYRASLYYLNQLGYSRDSKGPQEYAYLMDLKFGTNFNAFSNVYQKIKYGSVPLSEAEQKMVNNFYKPFIKQVRSKTKLKTRFSKFLNIYNTIHYFTQPKTN